MPEPHSAEPVQDIHIVLPVWGERYIRQCLDICIPTLLASGNVPAAAAILPVTFVLLTTEHDIPAIRGHPAWLALAAVCEARVERIDDLLSDASSTVLTLAYTRHIRSLGGAARRTGFIFLVADYIVADGSLRHVVTLLRDGADAVLAGNFQILPEAVGTLRPESRQDSGAALSIAPRALVRLGLKWLHPATRACMTDGAVHDPRANRVFFDSGPDTLVGRFYLMHMVAIRPATLDVTIAGPCDYSFVPEFCPEGRIETITESDAYLVAESQPPSAGSHNRLPGPLTPAALARSVAEWATARHRRNAAFPVVFRGAESAPALAAAIEESSRFVSATDRLLGSEVHPHRHHRYWPGALDHHQATARHPVNWEELREILGSGGVPEMIGGARQRLLGRIPRPRPWHPRWVDIRFVSKRAAAAAAGRSFLIVSSEPDRLRAHFISVARAAGARTVTHRRPSELLTPPDEAEAVAPPERLGAALVIVRPGDFDITPRILAAIADLMADNARVLVVFSDLSDATSDAVALADAAKATQSADPLHTSRVETVAEPRWRMVAQARMMASARLGSHARGFPARYRHLAVAAACAGVSLAANLACRGRIGQPLRHPCSTVLVHLIRERREAPATYVIDAPEMAETWIA